MCKGILLYLPVVTQDVKVVYTNTKDYGTVRTRVGVVKSGSGKLSEATLAGGGVRNKGS